LYYTTFSIVKSVNISQYNCYKNNKPCYIAYVYFDICTIEQDCGISLYQAQDFISKFQIDNTYYVYHNKDKHNFCTYNNNDNISIYLPIIGIIFISLSCFVFLIGIIHFIYYKKIQIYRQS